MIITALIQIVFGLFHWLITTFFPLGNLPTTVTTGWNYFMSALWGMDWILPIQTIIDLLTFSIIAELAILGFDITMWFWKKFRHG